VTLDWTPRFSARAAGMTASEIRELLKLLDRPDVVSFAGGIPDPEMFPADEVANAYARILSSNDRKLSALQYSVSEGYGPLRAFLAEEAGVDVEDVLVTNGSQQGLDFIGKLFIGPGDPVLVTAPTYLGALQAFSPYEPRYLVVPMDAEGPLPDALEAQLALRPRFFYLVPDFQNPTGNTVSLARRHAIVDLCARHGVPIIEDAAYTRLRYDGADLPSLLALDRARAADAGGFDAAGNVLYLGTFSKTLVPALRVGWVVAPADPLRRLVLIKQASDLHSSTINQMVALDVAQGVLDRQIPRLRATYKERRDAMLAALARHMPAGVTWTRPEGGMFVWLTLPDAVDGAALLARCVEGARVAFVPGAAFFPDRSGRNTIRLSFSLAKPEVATPAIGRLAAVVAQIAQ
jgi:DNA-binding transcriptional MocR family regulator